MISNYAPGRAYSCQGNHYIASRCGRFLFVCSKDQADEALKVDPDGLKVPIPLHAPAVSLAVVKLDKSPICTDIGQVQLRLHLGWKYVLYAQVGQTGQASKVTHENLRSFIK